MDTNQYWLERGKHYYEEIRLQSQYYKDQEQVFLSVVKPLSPDRVLELGCGFGRVTKALAEAMPKSRFYGVDLSQDQVENARKHCKDLDNVAFCQWDACDPKLDLMGADLVVCAEFLLHLPHYPTAQVIRKVLDSANYLVHETWEKHEVTAEHCFFHDYHQLYQSMGANYWTLESRGHKIIVARRI